MNLIKIADETLAACELGQYKTRSGKTLDIEDALDEAVVETEFVGPEDDFEIESENDCAETVIEITDETTSGAGRRLAAEHSNVAILNFASARHPGGGFLHGAKAQEEDLCRVSGLYTCLSTDQLDEQYYGLNQDCGSSLYTDAMIYTPNVPFFRDEQYNWLDEPYKLSVVTCPAPNLNRSHGKVGALKPSGIEDNEEVTEATVEEIFRRRIDRVLSAMVIFGHKNIVLGAWGCGAFGNNPKLVAKVFKEVLETEKFKKCFDLVVFAIPNKGSVNYSAFVEAFENTE
jgi:uncharacterized protein (TIGR02452 family)